MAEERGPKHKTMLEKALAAKVRTAARKPISDESIELFWAWVRCRITYAQAAKGLGVSASAMYGRLLETAQYLIANGELKPGPQLADLDKEWGTG